MLGALLGYIAELTTAAHGTGPIPYLGVLSELSAVVALVLGLLPRGTARSAGLG
jgi:hypothetical protein